MSVSFAVVLSMVQAVATEPVTQAMAPRGVALEIARVAVDELEAARLVATAWHEARLIPDKVGDHGKALCVFQLQHAPRQVLRDLRLCTELAAARLRASVAANPAHPFAVYLSGDPARAWHKSDYRERVARRLLD